MGFEIVLEELLHIVHQLFRSFTVGLLSEDYLIYGYVQKNVCPAVAKRPDAGCK